MIKIETINLREIEKTHEEWFFEEFQRKWKDNLELYEKLSSDSKMFIKELFELNKCLEKEIGEEEKEKIKKFSTKSLGNGSSSYLTKIKEKYEKIRGENNLEIIIDNLFNYDNSSFININKKNGAERYGQKDLK